MRYMTQLFLAIVLMFGTGMAYADISANGLTPAQRADMEAQIASLKAKNVKDGADINMNGVASVANVSDPQQLEKYAQFGEAIAKSLGSAAKELGVAVDEFMQTGTGTLVMVLVVYHFFGSDIIGILTCFIIIPLMLWMFNKFRTMLKIEGYKETDTGKVIPIIKSELSEDETIGYVVLCIGTFISIMIVLGVFLP